MMPADVGTVVALLLLAMRHRGATAECTACEDGSPQTEPPDKAINVPAFGSRTCAEIAGFAAFLPSSGDQCAALQSLGSLCGCPIAENACRLCGRGDDGTVLALSRPSLALEGVFFRDFVSSSAGPGSNESINCEVLEAVLHSHEQDSDLCLGSQYEYSELCGCQTHDRTVSGDTNSSKLQDEINTAPLPSPQNSVEVPQPAFSPCSLCPDGSQTEVLNKTLDFGDAFPAKNCVQLADLAGLLPEDTDECHQLQFFGTYCGCPIPEDTCTACANGDPILYPDAELNWFSDDSSFYSTVGSAGRLQSRDGYSCEILQSSMHAIGLWENYNGFATVSLCLIIQLKSSICGCEPPRYAVAIVWSYRAAAILSMLGSTLILYDILSRPKKTASTYHQLIIGICCFDLVSSTAYALSGVLNPKSEGFYSARGNESTCIVQAYMFQLGVMASMSYNVFLSLYYLFVIKYNWKEFRFRKYRRYVHVAVIVFGFVMSSAAFPFYGEHGIVCYIVSAPRAESERPVTFFYTIPLSIAVVLITAASVAVCWTVYKQERKGLRWSLRQNKKMKLTKKIVKQSLFYAASFYLTIPLAIMAFYSDIHSERHYALILGISSISAGQGFLNALVYFYRSGYGSCMSRVVKSTRRSLVRKPFTQKANAGTAVAGVNDARKAATNEQPENVAASPISEEEDVDSTNLEELERISESDPASQSNLGLRLASHEDMLAEPDVVNRADADTVRFDAAVEHWLSTQDDGQLKLPKRLSDLGNVFHLQEPIREEEHGTNPE